MSQQAQLSKSVFRLYDRRPQVRVNEAEYKRLLGLPGHYPIEGRMRELTHECTEWYNKHGHPWIYARQCSDVDILSNAVRIGDVSFSSDALLKKFKDGKAHSTVLAVVSAGQECEDKAQSLWSEGKPDEYYFLEVYGSAVTEQLVANLSGKICDWADRNGMRALPHFSPGYVGWSVADQARLWSLVQDGLTRDEELELEIMDSGMPRPKKSLLAVFGLTHELGESRPELVPCECCSLPGCHFRRLPQRRHLPRVEVSGRPEAIQFSERTTTTDHFPRTRIEPEYSIARQALQKWSKERLRLTRLDSRTLEAVFQFDGTTCSNLGRPLEFEYRVILNQTKNGYQIVDMNCAPTAEDEGHKHMCGYLVAPNSLMKSIGGEQPLLGRSLDEVFTWERPSNSSGCYCESKWRDHKWGLVLEVIHYALAT